MLQSTCRAGFALQTRSAWRVTNFLRASRGTDVNGPSDGVYIETIQFPCFVGARTPLRISLPRSFVDTPPPRQWCSSLLASLAAAFEKLRREWLSTASISINTIHTSRSRGNATFVGVSGRCRSTCSYLFSAVSPIRSLLLRETTPRLTVCPAMPLHMVRRHLSEEPTLQVETSETLTGSAAQMCGIRWYASHSRRSLIDLECLRNLCDEPSMLRCQRRVLLVVGFLISAAHGPKDAGSAAEVLSLLPISERVKAVIILITSYSSRVQANVLHEALLSAFTDQQLSQAEACGLLRVLAEASGGNVSLYKRHFANGVRCVITRGCGNSCAPENRSFVADALTLGERMLGLKALAQLCDECGLWYESTAYRSACAGMLVEDNVTRAMVMHDEARLPSIFFYGKSFGELMLALFTFLWKGKGNNASHIAAIRELCHKMPECVAVYTKHRMAALLARMEMNLDCTAVSGNDYGTALQRLLATGRSTYDGVKVSEVSWLHFHNGCGTASTASLLLPLCSGSWDNTVSVLNFTHSAGLEIALRGLQTLMDLTAAGRYYVIAKLRIPPNHNGGVEGGRGKRLCTLFFDVHAPEGQASSLEGVEGPRKHNEAASRDQRQLFLAHLSGANGPWTIPTGYVTQVASTLPQLSSTALSQWIRVLLRHGQQDVVIALLRVAAERGVVPEMEVLIELLEAVYRHSCYDHTGGLKNAKDAETYRLESAVDNIRSSFPDCAQAIFRAFVERTATRLQDMRGAPHVWGPALQLLSAVTALRMMHYPRGCMESVVSSGPPTAVSDMLKLLGGYFGNTGSNEHATPPSQSPVPLELTSLRRLLESAQSAELYPRVDIIAVASPNSCGHKAAWWSSHRLAAAVPVATAIYRRQAVGLWLVALQSIMRSAPIGGGGPSIVEAHHAIRIAAFGTTSSKALLKHLLLFQTQGGEALPSLAQRRRAQAEDAMLVVTLACVSGALVARGAWRAALRVIPPSVDDLPPLLHRARSNASRCEEGSGITAYRQGEVSAATRGRNKSSPRHRGCGMPAGVRRLVERMHLCDSFLWWDGSNGE